MKERGMMPQLHRLILHPLTGKLFLCVLASVFLVYLVGFARFLSTSLSAPPVAISEHPVETNPNVVVSHWTGASMRAATDADLLTSQAPDLTQGSSDTSLGNAAQQQGPPPPVGSISYPLSPVGQAFFSNTASLNIVCSLSTLASLNNSMVD